MTGYAIAIIVIVGLMVIFIGLFWIVTQISTRHYNNYVHDNLSTIRSLVIDYANQEVKFFNHNRLQYLRKMPMTRYLLQFSRKDASRFTTWINELMSKNGKASDSLQTEVRLHWAHRSYYSIFQVVKIDQSKKLINLDNYLFYKLSQKGRTTYNSNPYNLDETLLRLGVATGSRGYTANFKISSILHNGSKGDVSQLTLTQLKEVVASSYPLQQKALITTGVNEFALIDFRSISQNDAVNYLHNVVNEMRKFLEINSRLESVNIAIGLVYNSYSINHPKKIIEKAREMSKIASDKNTLIITYVKNMRNNIGEDKFHSEIEQVIKKKQLTYRFEAIYSIKKEKAVGYLLIPTPINAGVKGIGELYIRSIKTKENVKLVNVMTKDGIVAFRSQIPDNNVILFHSLVFNEALNFLTSIKNFSKTTKQGIVFDEYDVYYVSNNEKETFVETISKLKEKGVTVSLLLSDRTLFLDHKVYSLFDYFFVSPNMVTHKDDTNNLDLRVIIEKLIKYGRPIVLTDVDTWSVVELFIRSGVEYVASPAIMPISHHIEEVSNKTKAKIRRMLQ